MDYLPIQATSVPCERVFSSAKETDTAKRNRISPVLMEVLQLLKFYLKKERLDFSAGWVTSEEAMSMARKPSHSLPDVLTVCDVDDHNARLDDILKELGTYDGIL